MRFLFSSIAVVLTSLRFVRQHFVCKVDQLHGRFCRWVLAPVRMPLALKRLHRSLDDLWRSLLGDAEDFVEVFLDRGGQLRPVISRYFLTEPPPTA